MALLKSIREGFGLSVAEALWKEVLGVGGSAGGIPLQIRDGEAGSLVNTVEAAAAKTLDLLEHASKAEEMGKNGKEHVNTTFSSRDTCKIT